MLLNPTYHPEILEKNFLSEREIEIKIKIPKNLFYFEGHFRNMPIVAGVVQLHWAVKFSAELFKISDLVFHASQIKFSKFMRPEDEISLILKHTPEKHMVIYHYKVTDSAYSSGQYLYSVSAKHS